jgi:dTDP-4-amino-4,6-dideoxygalactose transaminase
MITVSKPYLPKKEKLLSYIDKIYESNILTNNGPLVQELEKKLMDYLKVKNLLLVTNGTLALQLAYKLLNIKGEVITTPFSFVATTSSLYWENLKPVFVDIDDTLNIDVNLIEEKITKNTSAILPVHVFGNLCDVKKIQEIADKNNLKVIYDSAHAFGVENALNYGDISIISFHATKLFHTIEGGALIIKDDKLYEKAKKIINFGYFNGEIKEIGINLKMNEFQAGMGLCVLEDINLIMEKRKELWSNYYNELKGRFQFQKLNTNNYHYFPIIFESEEKLLKVVVDLNKLNIYPRRYFYPSLDTIDYINENKDNTIDKLDYVNEKKCEKLKDLSNNSRQICKKSRSISKRILCLPLYYDLTKQEQDKIIEVLIK